MLIKQNPQKKKEIIYHKKAGPNKTKQAKWTQIFSTEKRRRKEEQSMFPIQREKERRKRVNISKD